MKNYFLLAFALVLAATSQASAQVLTGFGSSGVNPINPLTDTHDGWTGTLTANTFNVTSVSSQAGGLDQLFSTAIPVTNTTNFLTLTGTLVADPANGQVFDITVFDSTLLHTLTYQFKWNEFNSTDSSFTGQLLPALNVGTFNGSIGAWELDAGGSGGDTVSFAFDNLAFTATGIPEPSTYAMFGFGALLLYGLRRKIRVS